LVRAIPAFGSGRLAMRRGKVNQGLVWRQESPLQTRHPELVSGSIAPDALRFEPGATSGLGGAGFSLSGQIEEWILKQVQDDGVG